MSVTLETLAANLAALDRLLAERHTAQQSALGEAEKNLAAYKIANNEWRGTLADQRASFVPRAEYETKHESLTKAHNAADAVLNAQLADALRRIGLIEGRSTGIGAAVSLVISLCAIITSGVGIAIFALRH